MKPPIYSTLKDFPNALEAIAKVAQFGADKHNGGNIGWNREVSKDHLDSLFRHALKSGTIDEESGLLHDAHLAWRAIANLEQKLSTD